MTSGRGSRLDRRTMVAGLAAAAVGPWARPVRRGWQAPRPNLLFIMADDLGYADLSAYGRADYRTRHLDALARDGVRFTDAYASASTCTPTRVGLVTGRWPARFPEGLQRPMGWTNTSSGLAPGTPTAAAQLKAQGYRTTLVGKWHLGYLREFGPTRHGFDEFFGFLSGGVDYFTHVGADLKLDLWEGTEPVSRIGYLTDLLTDHAIEVVTRRDTTPFYLSLNYNAPHWPWEGPADAHERSDSLPHDFFRGGSTAVYAAMVQSLDAGVGRLLDALERSGRANDTIVIFTSDNGGGHYSLNWPFWERKWTLWEGGIRVPAMVRWPGVVRAGSISAEPLQSIDWAATLVAAAGGESPAEAPFDGVDLTPALRGQRLPERPLFWRQGPLRGDLAAMRAMRRGRWKYLDLGDRSMLFDLTADPTEKNDLSERYPERHLQFGDEVERWHTAVRRKN